MAWREQFLRNTADRGWTDLPDTVLASLDWVWAASPFIAGQCARRPELLFDLASSNRLLSSCSLDGYRAALRQRLDGVVSETKLMAQLRRFRNEEMVRIAWRDIAGWAGVMETLEELSALAECCLQETLDHLFRAACETRGTPINRSGQPQSLVVLGMGKLGAWELNFSSDIDLIFAYRDDGVLPDRKETTYGEFYARLARNLIKVLDSPTEDGFVFRVDTRLRPFGESGPIVMSFEAMEAYYESQAREWERYAMIKGRTVAGDLEAGAELEQFLRPFVYRRYLDYRTLGELRDLKQKIARELLRKDFKDNVKLGPGGIREIEFVGQAFQLIRGGQEAALRTRRILEVLDALKRLNLLPAEAVEQLRAAYLFLRKVENRLQQYADGQVHSLPTDPEAQAALIYGLGYEDWASFIAELDRHRSRVHLIFQGVVAGPQQSADEVVALDGSPAQITSALTQLGWNDPEPVLTILERFRNARSIRSLTARGEAELRRLVPMLVRSAASSNQSLVTLERLLDVVEAIASRTVYLSLLAENPGSLSHLAKLVGASPWISRYIAKSPMLLDELLDPRTLYTPLSKPALAAELKRKLASVDPADLEQTIIALCQFKSANVLRIAAADLSGAISVMVVSDYLTYLAEVLIEAVLRLAWLLTADRHGVPQAARENEPSGFAVIAYGKLGGFELGYGSDLDLVFLYEGTGTALTTGTKPLTVAEFYSRLGKRIIQLLTTATPSGMLYEVDLRLRPSGSSGLLVSTVEAYDIYQQQNAWTWEQQALVKARYIAGDSKLASRFAGIRRDALRRPRNREQLRQEVRDMREKMRESLNSETKQQFDVKRDPGGIVDIEFLVQFGVLSGARDHESLLLWTDVVRLLDSLAISGFLTVNDAHSLRTAYCAFREWTHRSALLEQPAVVASERYAGLRAEVSRIWRNIMGC